MRYLRSLLVLLTVFALAGYSFAETYTWTDRDGVLHFTDDVQHASPAARRSANDATVAETAERPDIVGRWSNRRDSFYTLTIIFNGDRTGQLMTAIGMVIPFSWTVLVNGRIELELREPSWMSGRGRQSRSTFITAEYDRDHDVIVVRDETKKGEETRLFHEDDGARRTRVADRKTAKTHAPKRLAFSEKTVDDSLTGLTWTRDLNIPGSVRRHRNAAAFLADLNRQGYGGGTDWRLPTLGEMQELFFALGEFGREGGQSTAAEKTPELFVWVGFANPRGGCYWTSTPGESPGERYAFILNTGEQRSLGHKDTCGMWPVRGR